MTDYEIATAQWIGKRRRQEDALSKSIGPGGRHVLVLADGMGGHVGGDTASRLCVNAAVNVLSTMQFPLQESLRQALLAANNAVRDHARTHPECEGMGSTLVCAVVEDGLLHWSSVGDSHLYLIRNGHLTKVNADHSMKPVLERMVRAGEITAAQAATDPGRHQLRSAIMGDDLELLEVSERAVAIAPKDTILLASDGLDTINLSEVATQLASDAPLEDNLRRLLAIIESRDKSNQDNTSLLALRAASHPKAAAPPTKPRLPDAARGTGQRAATTVAGLFFVAFVASTGFGWVQYRQSTEADIDNASLSRENERLESESRALQLQLVNKENWVFELKRVLEASNPQQIEDFAEAHAQSLEAEIASLWLERHENTAVEVERLIAESEARREDLQRLTKALASSGNSTDVVRSLLALKPDDPEVFSIVGLLQQHLRIQEDQLIGLREQVDAQQSLITIMSTRKPGIWVAELSAFATANDGNELALDAARIADAVAELESDDAPAEP